MAIMNVQDHTKRAAEVAMAAFPGATIRLPRSQSDRQPDFRVEAGKHVLAVEVKGMSTVRLSDLEGKLASATLTALRVAKQPAEQPVTMIEVPRVGPKTVAFAKTYMAREAADVGWCLFDPDGAYHFEVPSVGVLERRKPRTHSEPRPRPARGTLFSDLHRWMLKILLMRDVPSRLWGGPALSIQSVRDLATIAQVSKQTAYSFLRTFEVAGYVAKAAEGIVVVRRGELIRAWLSHDAAFQVTRVPVRSLWGSTLDLSKTLTLPKSPERIAVTGFEACRLLGVLHAPVSWREVCVAGSIEATIDAWQLKPCEPRDADLMLSKTAFPNAVLRGRVIHSNVPVVDVLEAAISVFAQVPSGQEQARHIFEHVLRWSDCI